MSLIDELTDLDLSAIVSAKANISVSVNGSEVQAVVDGGAVTSALGDLGAALAGATTALDDPQALFAPLVAAFDDLVDRLAGSDVPLADLVATVSGGVAVIVDMLSGLDADPLAFGRVLGAALPDALERFASAADAYEMVGLEELSRMTALVGEVEAGRVTDPGALAELAIDLLTPFSRGALTALRGQVTALLGAAAAVHLPTTRTQGLTVRLEALAAAAAAGDASAVTRLLDELERTRAQLVDVLRTDLAAVTTAIDRLPIADLAGVLAQVSGGIAAAEDGILEMFDQWAAELHELAAVVDGLDPQEIATQLRGYLDAGEAFLRSQLETPINATVDLVVGKVRELFAHLPIRAVRQEVSDALRAAAQAIADADLDAPVEAVRGVLGQIRDELSLADLSGRIQAALGEVAATLNAALDGVLAALEQVKDGIEQVAGPAADVLGRAVTAVQEFQVAVDGITAAVDDVDLQAAAAEVIDQVRAIREAVEGVVSAVPLPEPVRPAVTQLVAQLEALHLDADPEDIPILQPMLSVVGQLDISGTIGPAVHEGLSALREAVTNLVPASLVAEIEAEIGAALDVVGGFDPSTLLAGVTEQITAVADTIDGVDLVQLAQPVQAPFTALLDAWDRVRPSVLLTPVIDAYESALSGIALPSPEAALSTVGQAFGSAGERVGQTLAAPFTRLAPEGTTLTPPQPAPQPAPGGGVSASPSTVPPAPEPDAATLRLGDVVRMFGFLPNKLREALAALDANGGGAALAAIDGLVAGLARDLRAAADAVAGIEAALDTSIDTMLTPLGPAQLRAQLALRTGARGGLEIDLAAAMATVSRAGPGAVRTELAASAAPVRARATDATARTGTVAAQLRATADALAGCRLGGLTADLDDLLAALDPEPLAAELDTLAAAAYAKTPAVLTAVGAELRTLADRFLAMLGALNPGTLAGRFVTGILDVLREQLALFDPRLLAAELDELHAAVRAGLAAYDPAALAGELEATKDEIVATLRGLDPAALLGDLSGLTGLVDKAAEALPTNLLEAFPSLLTDLDEAFAQIDLDTLLDRVANLGPEVVEAFLVAMGGIRDEIVALLESLRYAAGQIEARVEVRAEVSTG